MAGLIYRGIPIWKLKPEHGVACAILRQVYTVSQIDAKIKILAVNGVVNVLHKTD